MRDPFNKSANPSPFDAEQALTNWGIKYEKKSDGSILVPGDLNISNRGLTRLPDLSSVAVGGNFSCANNQLTSLTGAPQTVGGDFDCSNNQLTSLEGAPQGVGGNFYCTSNQLTSLEHAPRTVGGNFSCANNQLSLLEGSPQSVGVAFYCHNNQLTSLEHAPQSVGGGFYCHNNQLTSLEHAPTAFLRLFSNFGNFDSWGAIPDELRTSPETKARLELERLKEADEAIHAATVLQKPVRALKPLSFRKIGSF